jgi:uncharacterized protein YsxB (DUF464 family)
MVTAEFLSQNGKLVGFKVSGHADFADYGNDIVCASVSSAVQLVCNTITECFKTPAEVFIYENQGISLKLVERPNSNDVSSTLLLEGFKLHLETLVQDFPKNIKIKITEV